MLDLPPASSNTRSSVSLVDDIQCARVVCNRLALLVCEQHLISVLALPHIIKADVVVTHFGRIFDTLLLGLALGSHNLLNLKSC